MTELSVLPSRACPASGRGPRATAASIVTIVLLTGCAMPDIWLPWNATETTPENTTSAQAPAVPPSNDLWAFEESVATSGGYIDASFIGDTDVIVALTWDGIFHLDPETLEKIREVPLPAGRNFSSESAIGLEKSGKFLSPNGTQVVLSPPFDELNGNFAAAGPCLIVSTADGSVLAEIPTTHSCNFAYSENQTYFFHSNSYENQVTMYDGTTFAVIATFASRDYPTHLAATKDIVAYTFKEFEPEYVQGVEFVSLASNSVASQVQTEGTVYGFVSSANYPWILMKTAVPDSLLAVSKETLENDGALDIPGWSAGEELAFASHEGVFAVATESGDVLSLTLTEVAVIDQFNTGVEGLSAILFSPDGRSLYAFGDQSIKFTRQ